MENKTIWVARVYGVVGTPSITKKGKLTIYNPGKHGWIDLKEFDNQRDADEWLCQHVRDIKGIMSDYTISRRTA